MKEANNNQTTDKKADFELIELEQLTAERLAELQPACNLPPQLVRTALQKHEYSRLEVYEQQLFLTYRLPDNSDKAEPSNVPELWVILSEQCAIFSHSDPAALLQLRQLFKERFAEISTDAEQALFVVSDWIVEQTQSAVEQMEEDLRQTEQVLFSHAFQDTSAAIFRLEGRLQQIHRAIAPLITTANRLARRYSNVTAPAYFDELYSQIINLQSQLDNFRMLLSNSLQVNLSRLSMRQNEDTRRISAWAAIAAAITVLSSIWGMNFQFMPELSWQWGYPLALLLMGAVAGVLYWLFKRSNWL